jgi:hypothetical protein
MYRDLILYLVLPHLHLHHLLEPLDYYLLHQQLLHHLQLQILNYFRFLQDYLEVDLLEEYFLLHHLLMYLLHHPQNHQLVQFQNSHLHRHLHQLM